MNPPTHITGNTGGVKHELAAAESAIYGLHPAGTKLVEREAGR